MSNVKITLSPDPIVKGQPFTLAITGNLDADFSAGNIIADLNVKALVVINEPVKLNAPFTLTQGTGGPGFAGGLQTITVGPITLPGLPGGIHVNGTIRVTNDKTEPVACVKIQLAAVDVDEMDGDQAPASTGSPVSICSKATDHMKNLAVSTDTQKVTHITGTLDEDIVKASIAVAVQIKIPLIKIPPINLAIPISASPGFKKGDLKLTVGPSAAQESNGLISVLGTVKANDGKGEEILCLGLNATSADTIIV